MWTHLPWIFRRLMPWLPMPGLPFVAGEEAAAPKLPLPAEAPAQPPDWRVPAYLRRKRASGDSIALARWQ